MESISIEDLVRRNAAFAASGAFDGLSFPTSHTLRVGCVDSRVDPGDVLGLKHVEDPYAAVRLDAALARAALPSSLAVMGMVTDVGTGLVNVI